MGQNNRVHNKVILFYGNTTENPSYQWFPSGALFVYSLLKDAGFEPILIHEFKTPDYEKIIKDNADDLLFFGVSAMIGNQIKSAIKAVKLFRKICPGVPIIWGGASCYGLAK